MSKKYHHGGYHGTIKMGGQTVQSGGGAYTSGNGGSTDSTSNNQTGTNSQSGETGSSGHKLLDALNKLKAEGKGDTEQAKVYERYLVGVEQKYQSEGTSLYASDPEYQQKQYEMAAGVGEFAGKPLTEWEKIQKLAGMEAGDPFDPENRYVKSFAGKEFLDLWEGQPKEEIKKAWSDKFGLPSIVATPTYYTEGAGDWVNRPIKTTGQMDEFGDPIKETQKYIYSGLGKTLMDQLEGATGQTSFDYGQAKDTYWDDRAAQESIDQSQRTSWGGYDGGSGGDGGGYYGDPRTGNPVEQMANFYTPQANLQQAMVNVHGTPTVFAKRGGIVSLLRL